MSALTSASVIVVGLGPGDPDLRTIATERILATAPRVILRTRVHPGLADLADDPRVSACDDLYEQAQSFDEVYESIAARVVEAARETGTVVYAVPGHPLVGERSVPLVVSRATQAGLEVSVLDAVSFIDSAIAAADIDPLMAGLQIVDAEQIARSVESEPYDAGTLGIDPSRAVLIGQVYSTHLASIVKIGLGHIFPDDHPIAVVTAAGVLGSASILHMPLHELDRTAVNHLTSVVIFPLPSLDSVRSPDALPRIVARLRAPGGCPWDREQSHESLRDAVLEEAYETVDAIEAGDMTGLAEELGDLLLLVTMHAQLAEEEGTFRLEDVYEGIGRKLIRRHPHVFADAIAATPDAVIATWDGVKAAERKAAGSQPRLDHPLDKLPRSMSPLRKAVSSLAPRTALLIAPTPESSAPILAAVRELIDRGIDPERALEYALRQEFESHPSGAAAPVAEVGVNNLRGEE